VIQDGGKKAWKNGAQILSASPFSSRPRQEAPFRGLYCRWRGLKGGWVSEAQDPFNEGVT
jgi:hypothetical protein